MRKNQKPLNLTAPPGIPPQNRQNDPRQKKPQSAPSAANTANKSIPNKSIPNKSIPGKKVRISVIIPSAPARSFNEIIENLRQIKPADLDIQIIIVKGTWPPLQRNLAIDKAKGEYIFLFDDDIIVPGNVIEKVIKAFGEKPCQDTISCPDIIGGPNLTPRSDGFMAHCFGLAHSSYFAGASTAARYFPSRRLKKVTESHLISCNLAFRANILKENRFDPLIFPNEENELLGRLQRKGYKLGYDPDFFVYHHRRKNLAGYIKQIFNWGAGRTLHMSGRPDHFNPIFLVPLAFLLYLLTLAFFNPLWYLAPLGLYLVLDIAFSLSASIKMRCVCAFFVMLWLFPLTHIVYALGLVWGLVRHFRRPPPLPDPKNFQTLEIEIT